MMLIALRNVTRKYTKCRACSAQLIVLTFFGKTVQWHGLDISKERGKKPTIVMESVADTDLWLWFVSIGWSGSLNDINIWDCSPLHKLMLQDEFERLDFEFTLNGMTFQTLYFLADGIYPPLARFVQTFAEPANDSEFNYAKWQEGSRKDVERAFGVLKGKFWCLSIPIEKWDEETICMMARTCVILHNCCVEERMATGQVDDLNLYQFDTDDDANNIAPTRTQVALVSEDTALQAEITAFDEAVQNGTIISDGELQAKRDYVRNLPLRCRIPQRRWENLYDSNNNFCLRNAIIEHKRNEQDYDSDENIVDDE